MLSSCFGSRESRAEERQPLLPRYQDDTALQRQLHQKLHTYQMLRALNKGYMPSNEQTVKNLRTLLAADLLVADKEELSDSGQALVHYVRKWLEHFIELLQNKNSEDQIQDLIWNLSNARFSIDTTGVAQRTTRAKAKADVATTYKSLQTVGSLLLTNSDFRLFLSDLNIVGREIFKDTAFTLSEVSADAGRRLEPSKGEQNALEHPSAGSQPSSQQELTEQVDEVSDVLAGSARKVIQQADRNMIEKARGVEGETIMARLKQAVVNLRKRPDYVDSVSTTSLLLKRWVMIYSHFARSAVEAAEENTDMNDEAARALKNVWGFLRTFGDPEEWDQLKETAERVLSHVQDNTQFDTVVQEIGDALRDMLTDPSFFDNAEHRFQMLRSRTRELISEASLREDIDALFARLQHNFHSALRDQSVARLLDTSSRVVKILSPAGGHSNQELATDLIHVFAPLAIQAIQYIPIPRLEISDPRVDLLLENLILEPGKTINHTSFLPYKLRVETYNDLEIRKARTRTTSSVRSMLRIKIDGFSVRAEEIGFWLRLHSGFLSLVEEGIASFELDERGIDIHLEVEVGRDRLEKILSLRAVRVHIHKLNYKLRKSRFALLAWMLKPILSRVIRKVMEVKIATGIASIVQAANRELVFARERLRATRISDPDDLRTFVRAVASRMKLPDNPDLYARIGVVQPGEGVFEGKYAPGSIVKLWNEEAQQAPQRIRERERDGWRNDIFDVQATPATRVQGIS